MHEIDSDERGLPNTMILDSYPTHTHTHRVLEVNRNVR